MNTSTTAMSKQNLPKLYHLDKQNEVLVLEDKEVINLDEINKSKNDSSEMDSNDLHTDEKLLDSFDNEDEELLDKNKSFLDKADEDKFQLDVLDSQQYDFVNSNNSKFEDDLNKSSSLNDEVKTEKLNEIKKNLTPQNVIDAINKLKSTRNRTDKQRLVRVLQRDSNLSRSEIVRFINQCNLDGIIERVKYRVYFGYRIPIKSKEKKSNINLQEETIENEKLFNLDSDLKTSSSAISIINNFSDEDDNENSSDSNLNLTPVKCLINAVKDLNKEQSSNEINAELLLKTLHTKRQLLKYDLNMIQNILKKQTLEEDGAFEELSNGNFKLKENFNLEDDNSNNFNDQSADGQDNPKTTSQDNNYDLNNNPNFKIKKMALKRKIRTIYSHESKLDLIPSTSENKKEDNLSNRSRPFSQRKKIKKSLGPDFVSDFTNMKFHSNNKRVNDDENKCSICSYGGPSKLIICLKCNYKAHLFCLKRNKDKVGLLKYEQNCFECYKCRPTCFICKKDTMSEFHYCDYCNTAHHLICITKGFCSLKSSPVCVKCSKSLKLNELAQIEEVKPIIKTEKASLVNFDILKKNSSESIETESCNSKTNLDIDLNEDASNYSNVTADPLQESPLSQLKQFEMGKTDNLTLSINCDSNVSDEEKQLDICEENRFEENQINKSECLNSLDNHSDNNDNNVKENNLLMNGLGKSDLQASIINEDSNQSNGLSSMVSGQSNIENNKYTKSDIEETLIQKYKKLFKAYDTHQEIEITKEQCNTLRTLNQYSNGKNPDEWTVEDVETFITDIGFPEQSSCFKKEEIDGKSLLLLRRTDVLTGLSMRLGPALKIYAHIYKLQGSI